MKYSVKSLSDYLQVDYVDARGFIKVMEKAGHIREVDRQKSESGKGKPTIIYELDQAAYDLLIKNCQDDNVEINDLSGVIADENV